MAQPLINQGPFIPDSDVYDVQAIYSIDINSDEFKEFLVRLRQSINNAAIAINAKDHGFYTQYELICGQQYFPDPTLTSASAQTPIYRPVFREVVYFNLPGGLVMGPNTKAHNIPISTFSAGPPVIEGTTFTRIYGTSNDVTTPAYIPLPYVSLSGASIELSVDATNVIINSQIARPTYTRTYVVLEYIKT